MEVTPTTPPKRSRSKAVAKASDSKRASKTLTTTRKKSADPIPAVATLPVAGDLQAMIRTTAFYLAAERRFVPGHELDDWLEAERRIKALYPSA